MTGQLHPGSHPDPDSLNAFVEGALPEHERLQCLAHFAECPGCREAVFLAQQPPPALAELSPIPVWRRWLAPIPVLSGALAACALAVVIILYLFHGPAAPGGHTTARANPATSTAARKTELESSLPPPSPPMRTRQRSKPHRHGDQPSHTNGSGSLGVAIAHDQGPANGLSKVTGSVTDASGAAVPDATVTLRQLAGAASGDARTDSGGHFMIAAIPAGRYELQIVAPGFQQASGQMELQAQGVAEIAAVLSVGASAESVTVVAANDAVFPTDSGQTSATSNQNTVTQLSLNVQDAAKPINIAPGVGSLSGTVTDSSNAVVPDAKVVLKDEAGQAIRESVSNGSGHFNFPAVQPGSYTLTVSAPGFTSWEERNIPFTQEASLTVPNIVLQVGGTKSEVAVVAANDVIVPTDTGQASTTLNQHMITQLSLAGRDAAELIKILPGMAGSGGGQSNKAGGLPSATTTVMMDKRMLTLNSAGGLLFSEDAGKNSEAVKPLWQGKVVRLAIVTQQNPAPSGPVFQITTDSGSVWFSRDGTHWNPAPVQR